MKDWAKVLEGAKSQPDQLKQFLQDPGLMSSGNKRLSLKGFHKEALCHGQQLHHFTLAMSELLDARVSDKVFLKVSQDHVRETVAHEIGHTIGLRHNFAGITGGNYPLSQREDLFKSYLTEGETPDGTVVVNSVMDYIPLQESVMTGDQIHRGRNSFAYDQFAVDVLYKNLDQDEPEEAPAFCTDSHARRFVDCRPFNLNASPVEYAKWQTRKNVQQLPRMLAEYFISRVKSVEEGEDRLPIDQIVYPSFYWSLKILNPRFQALSAMERGSRSLLIDRSYGWITEANIEDADKQFAQWVNSELEKHGQGDWGNILDHIPENFSDVVIKEFGQIIESEAYRKGTGPGGAYEFSISEIARMKKAVRNYMPELEKSLGLVDVLQLHTLSEISNEEVGEKGRELDDAVSKYLGDKASSVVFATKRSREDPESLVAKFSLMRLQVKATISEKDQNIFLKKMILLKMMLEQMKELNYLHDDGEPTKKYKPEELETIASGLLNEELEKLMSQIDLDSLLGAVTGSPDDHSQPDVGMQPENSETNVLGQDPQNSLMAILETTNVSELEKKLSQDSGFKMALAGSVERLRTGLIGREHGRHTFTGLQRDRDLITRINGLLTDSPLSNDHESEMGPDSGRMEIDSRAEEPQDAEEPEPMAMEVPVSLHLPVVLPEFRHENAVRVLAARLLDNKKGESPAFGLRDRSELADRYTEFYNTFLRGEKIPKGSLPKQTKALSVFIQENDRVLNSFSDSSLLSLLLGLL